MKTRAVFSFFLLIFGLLCSFAAVSFAREGSGGIVLGDAQPIQNVLVCQDKDEALYVALREVEFFTAKKPVEEFYTEIDKYALACGVRDGLFMPLEIIHTYIGYYGGESRPNEVNIVETAVGVNFKSRVYLFIPSMSFAAH